MPAAHSSRGSGRLGAVTPRVHTVVMLTGQMHQRQVPVLLLITVHTFNIHSLHSIPVVISSRCLAIFLLRLLPAEEEGVYH